MKDTDMHFKDKETGTCQSILRFPRLGEQVRYLRAGVEHTATVCYVRNEACVNLCVLDHQGGTFPVTSALLSDSSNQEGRWYWA